MLSYKNNETTALQMQQPTPTQILQLLQPAIQRNHEEFLNLPLPERMPEHSNPILKLFYEALNELFSMDSNPDCANDMLEYSTQPEISNLPKPPTGLSN